MLQICTIWCRSSGTFTDSFVINQMEQGFA
jgi:hypothetical protein